MKNKEVITVLGVVIAIFALLYFLFTGKKNNDSFKSTVNNYIVLLDLSDRLKSPSQAEKDKILIEGIYSVFENEVKRKQYQGSRDIIKVLVAPQPANYSVFDVSENLEINLGNIPQKERYTKYPELRKKFFQAVSDLYKKATQNTNYIGADIWSFFNASLENHLIKDKNGRNILLILTDGYLNFNYEYQINRPKNGNKTTYTEVEKFRKNPKWKENFVKGGYGLIPIDRNLGNLEVYMLELSSSDIKHPEDFDIIRMYWEKWFKDLNINKYKCFKTEDAPKQVTSVLKNLLQQNKNK